jgi:hypothetical protein
MSDAASVRTCLIGLAAVLVLGSGVTACGRRLDRRDSNTLAPTASTSGAEVSALRVGADGHSLVATIPVLPVRGSTGVCAVKVTHTLDFAKNRVFVWLVYETRFLDPAFPGCRVAPRRVAIDLGAPVAHRHVITQSPPQLWVPGAGVSYHKCDAPACDEETGKMAAPASCEGTNLPDAVRSSDYAHAGLGTTRCELPWAVVDVDIGSSACGPTDGGPNPCVGQRVHRMYWRTAGPTWRQVAQTDGPGCGDIAKQVPEFPRKLCAGLPAP